MAATIKQLAEKCGLSISAVSKALNNYPDVSERTRALVQKTAREMGYFPNALARGLKTSSTFNIGVILDTHSSDTLLNSFFICTLNGFKCEVERHGYDMMMINRGVGKQRLSYLNHCRFRNVDGVCVLCVDFSEQGILELARSDLPLVTIDHLFTGKECVLSDNRTGMRTLTEYIIGQGHRRIAYIHGTASSVTDARLLGYYEALEDHGIQVPAAYAIGSEYHNPQAQMRVVDILLALETPPTCIIMTDDHCALGGIRRLQEHGLRVPEDISVAGYDGVAMIQQIPPRLTTVAQDGEEIGRRAAARLIHRIENRDDPYERPDVVASTLIEGETVARIKA